MADGTLNLQQRGELTRSRPADYAASLIAGSPRGSVGTAPVDQPGRRGSARPFPYPRTVAALPATGYDTAKRALDLLVAVIALALTWPIIAILVVLIRIDSPGPALFRQQRVGQGGRPFTFYKFRTMYADARERFPELYAYQYTDEQWQTIPYKQPDDPRLTRFGRRLRQTTLDELPNLINVLLGHISLVGPRPELPEYLRYYTREQMAKFSVQPGMTGLAQTTGRGWLTVQEIITADLEYVRRRSFWFDISLLLRTAKMVVLRVGAF